MATTTWHKLSGRLTRDVTLGLKRRAFWAHLAQQDVTLQYARSAIGPFWVTLTMGMQLVALTFLFTGLFGAPVEIVAPWVTIGVIVWTFMASSLNEASSILWLNKPYLLEAEASISGFVGSVIIKNMILAAHHSILIVLTFIWLAIAPNWTWAWLLVSLPIIIVFTAGLGIALAVVTTRFRDIQRITESLLMVGFFLTPVLWRPQELISNKFIATYNPFTHLIAIVRQPLIGQQPEPLAWMVSLWSTLFVVLLAIYAIARFRKKVQFWL